MIPSKGSSVPEGCSPSATEMVAVGIVADAAAANVEITPLVRRGLSVMGRSAAGRGPICLR